MPRSKSNQIYLGFYNNGGRQHAQFHLSKNLCTHERVSVLSDGKRLALKICPDGTSKLCKRDNKPNSYRSFRVRVGALKYLPDTSGIVSWHREGDLIVIEGVAP